jgi:hypothetical protein
MRPRSHRTLNAVIAALVGMSVLAGPTLATSDTVGGHLHHDGSLTLFNIWRLHTGGKIHANLNNGPNANKSMRMGLRGQNGTQFSSSQQWDNYPIDNYFTDWSGNPTFSQRWFAINARMVDACGIFCDDDFGGTLYFSIP